MRCFLRLGHSSRFVCYLLSCVSTGQMRTVCAAWRSGVCRICGRSCQTRAFRRHFSEFEHEESSPIHICVPSVTSYSRKHVECLNTYRRRHANRPRVRVPEIGVTDHTPMTGPHAYLHLFSTGSLLAVRVWSGGTQICQALRGRVPALGTPLYRSPASNQKTRKFATLSLQAVNV